MGEEWGPIKSIITHPRPRGINDTHLDDSGHYGFGGHCLPKDTAAITSLLEEMGIATELFRSLSKDNSSFSDQNKLTRI